MSNTRAAPPSPAEISTGNPAAFGNLKKMIRAIFLSVLLAAPCALANSAGSAIQALQTAAALPGAKTGAIVELRGTRGEPLPASWTVLLADPSARGGVRELTISNGAITAERTPLQGFAGITELPAIDPAKVTMDANNLFHAVQAEAEASRVGFHWVDYTLRTNPATFLPEWTATLHDSMGVAIGTTSFSAQGGGVLKPLELTENAPAPEEKHPGGLFGRISDFTETTAKKVGNTTLRTIGNVQEFLVGERTIGPKENE